MAGLRIGPAGAPRSTVGSGTVRALRRCAEIGFSALEVGWVHKVTVTEPSARRIRAAVEETGVRLSVHAPYFINLNSHDSTVRDASVERIVAAGRAAEWAGARDVVLHLAFTHDDDAPIVFGRVRDGLVEARAHLGAVAERVTLRAEVMGRASQFGDLEEILRLCAEVPGVAPCIDIAHLHARTGAWNTPGEFADLWRRVADALGPAALGHVHVHLSGIEYGLLGERRHLPLDDADLDWVGFLRSLVEAGVRGTVITESPRGEDDASAALSAWRRLVVSS